MITDEKLDKLIKVCKIIGTGMMSVLDGDLYTGERVTLSFVDVRQCLLELANLRALYRPPHAQGLRNAKPTSQEDSGLGIFRGPQEDSGMGSFRRPQEGQDARPDHIFEAGR